MENRSIKIFAVIVALGSLLASCNKMNTDKQVYVDSYIHTINNRAGVPVYNLVHSAFCYSALKDVSVKGSTGSATALPSSTVNGFSFFTKIDSASYQTTPPAADFYTYNATYDSGDAVIVVDPTSGQSLVPAQELTATKTATDIVMNCKPVATAEAYKVRIFSDSGDVTAKALIFESNFLVPADRTANLNIPFSLTNLSQYLSSNLSFEVSAFIFEQGQDTYEAVSTATLRKMFTTSN
jgi:hypothetical protein